MKMFNKALLIGESIGLMQSIPQLLNRAGFEVDVIATRRLPVRPGNSVRLRYVDSTTELLAAALTAIQHPYNLVIIADDATLGLIAGAPIPDALKLKLLPICSIEHIGHLYSKIGLAEALHANQITAPAYRVAHHRDELVSCGLALGFPLLVKVDASAGGHGVYECRSEEDLNELLSKTLAFPVLLQEKIEGQLLDLSGFYQAGELIHFGYATFQATMSGSFGPSSVRLYRQLSEVPDEVFEELRAIGQALGLDGFTNLTCLLAQRDGKRYYFEVDVRPTVWSDHTKYIGNDLALAIRGYFQSGTTLRHPVPRNPHFPTTLRMVYPYRLRAHELLFNRYQSWKWLMKDGPAFMLTKIALKLAAVFRAILNRQP